MRLVISILDTVLAVLRTGTAALLAAGAVLAALAWAVRTRRVPPFGGVARFVRQGVDPLLAPLDRRLVRHGVPATSVPWWGLLALLLLGASAVFVVGFVRDTLASLYFAANAGPRGLLVFAVRATFLVLQLALLVRVVTSWIGGTHSRVGRVASSLTEWFLGPLRRALPSVGMVDISPLVAWFLLSLLESVVVGAL